jgi:hypothetical protein
MCGIKYNKETEKQFLKYGINNATLIHRLIFSTFTFTVTLVQFYTYVYVDCDTSVHEKKTLRALDNCSYIAAEKTFSLCRQI